MGEYSMTVNMIIMQSLDVRSSYITTLIQVKQYIVLNSEVTSDLHIVLQLN